MLDCTLDDLLENCPTLTWGRQRYLHRLCSEKFTPACVLLYWTADELYRQASLSAEDVQEILTGFAGDIQALGEELNASAKGERLAARLLTVHDRRWVHFYRAEFFLDLQSTQGDGRIRQLPRSAVEVTAYDLTALYLARRAKFHPKIRVPL